MRSDIIFHFVCVLFLIVIISVQTNAQDEQWAEDGQGGFILSGKREASDTSGRRRNHRLLRNLQRLRGNNILMELASDGQISPQDMQQFTSAPPAPADVNCYVEVEQTVYESHPGRCVRLGSTGIHACQASGYMDINNVECVQRSRNTPTTSRPQHVTTTTPAPM